MTYINTKHIGFKEADNHTSGKPVYEVHYQGRYLGIWCLEDNEWKFKKCATETLPAYFGLHVCEAWLHYGQYDKDVGTLVPTTTPVPALDADEQLWELTKEEIMFFASRSHVNAAFYADHVKLFYAGTDEAFKIHKGAVVYHQTSDEPDRCFLRIEMDGKIAIVHARNFR